MTESMIIQDANMKYYPNMDLAHNISLYEAGSKKNVHDDDLKKQIIEVIVNDKIANLYEQLSTKFSWSIDPTITSKMRDENEAELKTLDAKIVEAGEMGGETEIMEALFAKARFLSKTSQWTEAFVVYDEILAKPKSSTGKKIDALMEKARISFFNMDLPKLNELITEAKKYAEIGGDWDRRNRLKVYEAIYLLITRNFQESSALFIDGISTFSCVELCSYDQFIFYAVSICIMTLPRTELYKKIINNPQIIAVIRNQPELQLFLQSIYNCDYKTFFQQLMYMYTCISTNRYLSPHIRHMIKEYRILAYAQFLEAYKSVLIPSMADSFGISITLLDHELSHFISVGRLSAKIDKVGGIVVSSRSDMKNTQYQDIIKKGDVLLNHIQKLVRVIDV